MHEKRRHDAVEPDTDARIDEALEASFPASDPPPWTLGPPTWSKPSKVLHAFRHSRLIVQSARATAFEAARAMQTNQVGAIVVSERGVVVGIVTDRDLVERVIGADRDPHTTRLRDVMSRSVATLAPDASERDALRVMTERRVRRVPLVRNGRLVGLVTLDDLLFKNTAKLDDVMRVIRAQVIETGPAQTRRFDEWKALERRYARALSKWQRFSTSVRRAIGLETRKQAELAIEIVVGGIVRRLEPATAELLTARLPVLLRLLLAELPPGPDPSFTRSRIEEEVEHALAVDAARARAIVDTIGLMLARTIDPNDAVGRRLPSDLRTMLVGPLEHRAADTHGLAATTAT